jgi:hypothetical protein
LLLASTPIALLPTTTKEVTWLEERAAVTRATKAAVVRALAERRRNNGGQMEPIGARHEHTEGTIARSIEEQTAKLPSDLFLWAAVSAMAGSAALQLAGQKHVSNFIGEWVPTLLIFGLYNKMVKILGSEPRPQTA